MYIIRYYHYFNSLIYSSNNLSNFFLSSFIFSVFALYLFCFCIVIIFSNIFKVSEISFFKLCNYNHLYIILPFIIFYYTLTYMSMFIHCLGCYLLIILLISLFNFFCLFLSFYFITSLFIFYIYIFYFYNKKRSLFLDFLYEFIYLYSQIIYYLLNLLMLYQL